MSTVVFSLMPLYIIHSHSGSCQAPAKPFSAQPKPWPCNMAMRAPHKYQPRPIDFTASSHQLNQHVRSLSSGIVDFSLTYDCCDCF
jgi:hypothetical protein